MSYAFDGDCANTVRYEEMVIAYWKTREREEPQNAFYQQGEMANEAARVCIDVGDFNTAEKYYRLGSELGLREQERFFPYLVGYVALYTNDLKTAEAELTKAVAMRGNDRDPFMHVLLATTYEKTGQQDKATALFRKAYDLATAHNPPAAYARPFTREKLGIRADGSGR